MDQIAFSLLATITATAMTAHPIGVANIMEPMDFTALILMSPGAPSLHRNMYSCDNH